jgi:O-acetyl-ADP-ribose deacetylase (regulator of RNase III)
VIRAVVDDITFVPTDAVLRPTTSTLEPTVSSLKHLDTAAGVPFSEQISTHSELAVGSAVVTDAGDLAADMVIHAVVRSIDEPVTENRVRQALMSALQRAGDWEIERIATPPIGTGAGNLSAEDAARIMVEVLSRAMATATYPREVCIVVNSEEEKALFDTYLKRVPQ